ncbi:FAD-binding protein [Adlercreutzia equolifaciens]|uniref:FAD-binding protein n=1 Tax=Adlercreutzia equolifaciens TaxID=446660 RepID=UPI0027BADC3B|nr:FAD-binding protein [Adlercreutzia equolifaciens]
MSSNVTRRSFFKGAGLAALGGLSAAALSGCGHGYAAAEPTNPSTGDFGGPSWLGAPPVIDEADIAETIETEVLVVGMGTGGIPAMISAAENGARVLGIDRQGTPHNVREDIGAIDSRLQQASFDEFPEFRIEKKEAVEDIVRYANGFVNYDLVKLWADESGAMVDWLTDIIQRDGKLVMEFEGGVGDTSDPGRDKAFATGHSPQKTDAVAEDEEWGFAESILAYAAEQGAEVRWYTEFIKCETDESGRVTGVIARDVQGERPYLRINASKGVILSNGFVNYDLVKLWADESGAMVDWLTDIIQRDGKLVMEFEGGVGDTSDPGRDKAFATGHSPQKTDAVAEDEEWGFAESILAYAAEQGAEVRWYTEFIKCETDESGRVTGVIARDVQGERPYLRINASKGVILSTGGYGNNLEMMEDRQAWNQKIRIAAPGSGGNPTGSGIKAALWLGATMDPLGAACTFNRACVKPDQYAGDGVLGRWFWFGEQPFLKLNLKGERFCNESGPYDYMLHSTIMQPHQTYVDIWDANHAAQAEAFDEVGCCRLFPFPNGAKNNIPMQVVDGMIEKLIEDGYVQKADTMEELAEKLNLPVETTVASWKHYNEMAAAGEDTDYYKEKHRLMAIDTPPFYGVRTGAWFLATLDGVTIDTNMHPCDENGDPIEGLYLTGNDSGGFFSVSYPNLLTGLACGRTMTFGRRAGMLAATGQA